MSRNIKINVISHKTPVGSIEVVSADITISDGALIIGDVKYRVVDIGEDIPIGVIEDAGDGEPRLVTSWRGLQNHYHFEDITLEGVNEAL